jgi:predicted PurR-regulated permease PerM
MRYPTRFQQKTLWNAATGVSILVLGALLVVLVWVVGQVFGFLQPVLIPLIVAGIIAYVLDPVVCLLERRGFSRVWSVVTLFLTILAAATLLVATIVPGLQRGHGNLKRMFAPEKPAVTSAEATEKIDEAAADDDAKHLAPEAAKALDNIRKKNEDGPIGWLLSVPVEDEKALGLQGIKLEPASLTYYTNSRAGKMLTEYQGVILKTGRNWLSMGSSKLFGFLGLFLGMIMVPIYLFFFLKDSASIRSRWHHYVPLKASHFKTELVETLQEINGYLVSFFRGQVLVAAIDGVLVGLALMIFGLPYGLLIGVFMAILGVIPYIGSILCLIPACIIAYLHAQGSPQFGLSPMAYVSCVVAIFVVVQQINSLVTAPKIVGDSVGLHPLTVIFSMLFWSVVLGGFVGTLLAVPMTAAIKVLFRRFIWERQLKAPGDYTLEV